MNIQSKLFLSARVLAAAPIVALVAVVALPEAAGRVVLAVSGAAVLVLLAVLVAGWRRSFAGALCVGLGATMMTGAMIYLKSLDPDGADIPLGGVGGLFLGLVLLVVGLVRLREPDSSVRVTP